MPSTATTAWVGLSATTAATDNTWLYWIDETATSRTDLIFNSWTTGTVTSTTSTIQIRTAPSANEVAEFAARIEARRRHERELILEERRANRRALTLLLMLMSPEQRAEFKRKGHFHVIGGRTGQRYRIRRGTVGNVDVLDGERVKHRLCAHPTGVPEYDVLAAQLLHLQEPANEEQFIRTANIHPAMRVR